MEYWTIFICFVAVVLYIIYGLLWFAWVSYFNLEGVQFRIESEYGLELKPEDEQNIKIKAIYLYPIRGVKGMSVSSVQITPHGLAGDRNWVIVNAKTKKSIDNENSDRITFIRLEMKDKYFNEIIVKL